VAWLCCLLCATGTTGTTGHFLVPEGTLALGFGFGLLSSLALGFGQVVHYEIVVLDPEQEQFTSMVQMLMCCSDVGLQW
jgi:hypothetical protein